MTRKKRMMISAGVLLIAAALLFVWIQANRAEKGGGENGLASTRHYGGTNIGINFWYDDTNPAYFNVLLPKIAATNAHIKVGVHHLVDPAAGYTVTPLDDADFSVIRMCIEKAQALGIKVDMLMIYTENKGDWAKQIEPASNEVASFFAHHQAAAMNVAALCDTYCIPILGLINECNVLTDSDKASYWADETRTIKKAYPKLKLTFASTTWNGETRKLLDYKKAGIDNICNYLDFLGVNLYPTLTKAPPASVTADQLANGWYGMDFPNASTADCSLYQLLDNTYKAYSKQILVTEIGCVPKERGLEDPLNIYPETQKSEGNKHVQYLYIKTAYDVLGASEFIAGIYIWDACDTWTPFYWLGNSELVPYITDYYRKAFNRSRVNE